MAAVIRPFRAEDAPALSALTVAAIATLGLRAYSARQVMVWATRLHTQASELSRPVFARAGFALIARRDFALELGGEHIPMHNYAMEKPLASCFT